MAFGVRSQWGIGIGVASHWSARAACRDVDPDIFFPVGEGSAARYQAWQAKQICRICPVLADCAQWVKRQPQEFGVFAAMTPAERRGKPAHEARQHCQRCSQPFAWDPQHPHARLCQSCDRRRTVDQNTADSKRRHLPRKAVAADA